MDGWMDEWMNGWMDECEWMDGCEYMNGLKLRSPNFVIYLHLVIIKQ